MNDPVNHPAHYKTESGLEAIDVIVAFLGVEGAYYYCRGNALKYELRAGQKSNTSEDHHKAAWYATKAAELWDQFKPLLTPTTDKLAIYLDDDGDFWSCGDNNLWYWHHIGSNFVHLSTSKVGRSFDDMTSYGALRVSGEVADKVRRAISDSPTEQD